MTQARPTGYPEWASGLSATNIAEPTTAQKQQGWNVNQIPPSSYQNWLDSLTYGWTKYLDDSLLGPGFNVRDDLTGRLPDESKWFIVGYSNISRIVTGGQADDSTGGAFGAMIFIAANTASGLQTTYETPQLPLSTGMWKLESRLRTPYFSGGTSGFQNVILNGIQANGVGSIEGIVANGTTFAGRWAFLFAVATGLGGLQIVDSGLRPSPSAYERLVIERVGDRVLMAIIGPTGVGATSVFSTPAGVNFGSAKVQFGVLYGQSGSPTLGAVFDYMNVQAQTGR